MKDLGKAADNMVQHTQNIMSIWLVEGNKAKALQYYARLSPIAQELLIKAFKEEISKWPSPEFKQAAKDIPAYIEANSQLSQYE